MLSRRLLPPFLLALVTLGLWSYVTSRYSVADWQTPLQYHGDPLEIYARVQAAAEDPSQPLRGFSSLARLAAPFGADWSRYPVSDRVVFTGLGLLARGVGVFAAVNLAIALGHILNALAFYACARFLRWRHAWAFALALLFSFCGFNFRWGVTVSFGLTFFIPPFLLLCAWIARPAPAVRARAWTWLALVLGLWLGGANPYFGFFAGLLAVLAVGLQLLRRRDRSRSLAGAAFLGALGLSFVLHNLAYFLAPVADGSRLTLVRSYAGSEIYALKLTDLVVPPAEHTLSLVGKIGRAYQAQSALRGEFFVNYLGVFGLAGLVLLAVAALRPLLLRRAGRVPDASLAVAWTLLFAAVGGLNSLLALGGLDHFRASNRYSIFILVWALWFFGRWCQRRLRSSPLFVNVAAAALVAVIGLADSLPRLHASSLLRRHAADLSNQRALMQKLETELGAGARVFQVPAPPFPEAGVTVTLPDYEHFVPYLTSHTLRFSYGALRGTAHARALQALGRVPPKILRDELEATGFHAVWIDRRGMADNAEGLIRGLRALEVPEIAQTERPDVVIFKLNPADHPRILDLTDPSLFEPWDMVLALPRPRIAVYDGWFDYERDGPRSWRWAQNHATAGLVLPEDDTVQLSFRLRALSSGELVLILDDREIWRHAVTPAEQDRHTLPLTLKAGRHRLTWNFTGELVRPATGDARLLGFAVENLRVRGSQDDGRDWPMFPFPRKPGDNSNRDRAPGNDPFPRERSGNRPTPPTRDQPTPSAPSPESNSPAATSDRDEATPAPTPSPP